MDVSASDIVEENQERRAELFAEYDPYSGEGSPIPRVPLKLTEDKAIRVPVEMTSHDAYGEIREAGTVSAWADERDITRESALEEFQKFRCEFDFEFWCAVAANIELDAESRDERGQDIAPLILNRAQRLYWKELHDQWVSDEPVRVILLKARQWGGSTLTQCFFAWVQRFHRDAWNAFICNLSLDQARHVRKMYDRLATHYPRQLGSITLTPYEGSSNQKLIKETDSIVGVTTIENPDSPRSYSIHLAHLSEVGLWPSTPKVNAADFAQAITGAVSSKSDTVIVEESTARGVGTYFHNHWQEAGADKSSYEQVFIAWHDIPKYTAEPRKTSGEAAFARKRLRPEEEDVEEDDVETARRLWRLGATLEGIRWYFGKLRDFKGDLRRMQSEFPSTAREAFQSTGRRFFSLDLSAKIRSQTKEPAAVGKLTGAAVEGEEALEELSFRRMEDGPLKVWRRPDEKVWWNAQLLNPEGSLIKNRFCGFADFGGKTREADWSVLTIADRIKMIEGGPVEVVARLRLHMRPDLFAWASARLAQWYDEALLAYEVNRHRKDRGDDVRGYEPEWSLAVLKEVEDEYDNLYYRQRQERVDEKLQLELGFHMNSSTKPLIYNTLEASLSDVPGGQIYYDPDVVFVDELDTFEKKDDGRLGAVEGNNDDVADSSAGTSWLAIKHMDPVQRIDEPEKVRRPAPDAATF